ncbi:MAG: hypothetical protein WCW84_07765 [Sulfurimonas sp.]|jgi:hypothetical protein
MHAIREIVSRDIFKNFDIPEEFGDTFEMILVPVNNIAVNNGQEDSKKENEKFLAANYNAAIKEDAKEDEIWSKYL